MDHNTTQTLLKELLCCLIVGRWWFLHQKEELNLGLAKVFGRTRAEIDALFSMPESARRGAMVSPLPRRKWIVFVAPCLLTFKFKPVPSTYM